MATSASRTRAQPPATASRHPDLAAPAQRVRPGDAHVADVAGGAVRAAVDPALGEQPSADSRADLAVDQVEVLVVATRAFVQREEVHVVVDPDRRVVALFEPAADVEPVPPRHDGRRDRSAGLEVDGPGDADGDAPHRHVRGPGEHVVDHRKRRVERLGRSARDVPRAMGLLQDVALEHRDADVDVQSAQGAHDDATAAAAEVQGAGSATTGGGAELAVFEVAHLDRLVDTLRDDASTEAGDPADLRVGSTPHRTAPY